MTKKIPPNFLRHFTVLIIFLQSFLTFSQNVDVTITVDWLQWARDNKVQLNSLPETFLQEVTHPSGYLSGSFIGKKSSDTHSGASSTLFLAINDNILADSVYSEKITKRNILGYPNFNKMKQINSIEEISIKLAKKNREL